MPANRDPQTPKEWREAVLAAEAMLLFDSAERYGLITGPEIDVARCSEIVNRGRTLGYVATEQEISAAIRGVAADSSAHRDR